MVGQNAQDGWIRACLAGPVAQTLSFHPFSNQFSIRALADTKAATAFMAHEQLEEYYLYAQQAPMSIIAGVLAARVDLLLAQCYSGVATNITKCINEIASVHPTPAQAVYWQLWRQNFSDHVIDIDDKGSLLRPLSQVQCFEITQLLAEPHKLAVYLASFIQRKDRISSTALDDEAPLPPQSNNEQADDSDIIALQEGTPVGESSTNTDDSKNQSGTQDQERISIPSPLYSPQSLQYPILTSLYDRQMAATDLAPLLNYGLLRARITQQLPEYDKLSRRLANKLRAQLMSLQQHAWQDDLEEGYLHSAKLSSVIASPTTVRPFRQEIQQPFPATAVTLLIDCSGSMQGKPLLMAAAWVDILVEALELCQIKTEILGFTTGHWDDGPVQKQWQQQGSKNASGRLNDLLHLEFKGFEQVWRRARHGLAAVLEPQWQKENIDGEALDWAYQRLKGRAEPRKLLFVLSDAKPYDQLTLQNNDHNFLEQDLLRRVNQIEQQGRVDLIGIGVGHRVCRIYPAAVQIKQLSELPQTMLDTLLEKLKASAFK
jgi:hypothetical protein